MWVKEHAKTLIKGVHIYNFTPGFTYWQGGRLGDTECLNLLEEPCSAWTGPILVQFGLWWYKCNALDRTKRITKHEGPYGSGLAPYSESCILRAFVHANTPKMTRNELDFVSTVYGSVMILRFNVGLKPSQFGQVFRPYSRNYWFACEHDLI